MFPQVDIDRPHVAHFLSVEFGYANKKMWVVSIDMSTKTVESFSLHINGDEGRKTDDADLIEYRSMAVVPFIPCEFPKFLNLSRYAILLLPFLSIITYLLLSRFRFCRRPVPYLNFAEHVCKLCASL